MEEEIDVTKLPTTSLINVVSMYRSLKINKDLAIKCMVELDKRQKLGEDTNHEDSIDEFSYILKSVGDGYIAKVVLPLKTEKAFKQIKEIGLKAFIVNKEKGFIHIGSPSENQLMQVEDLALIESVSKDRKFLEDAVSTKIS